MEMKNILTFFLLTKNIQEKYKIMSLKKVYNKKQDYFNHSNA